MSWKSVNTTAFDIKKHKGEPHIGEYTGSHEIQTKIGKQTIYEFIGEDGIGFGIYGFTNLNRAMEIIPTGRKVRLTYTGTTNIPTKYGMKDVHQIIVEVEEEEAKKNNTGEEGKENKDDLPF